MSEKNAPRPPGAQRASSRHRRRLRRVAVGAPDFGGGVRESALPIAHFDPRQPTPVHREGGWVGTEIDAAAIFPWLLGP